MVIPVQFEDFAHFVAGFAKVKKDGEEFIPTEAQLKEREQEMNRRGWIDFSS